MRVELRNLIPGSAFRLGKGGIRQDTLDFRLDPLPDSCGFALFPGGLGTGGFGSTGRLFRSGGGTLHRILRGSIRGSPGGVGVGGGAADRAGDTRFQVTGQDTRLLVQKGPVHFFIALPKPVCFLPGEKIGFLGLPKKLFPVLKLGHELQQRLQALPLPGGVLLLMTEPLPVRVNVFQRLSPGFHVVQFRLERFQLLSGVFSGGLPLGQPGFGGGELGLKGIQPVVVRQGQLNCGDFFGQRLLFRFPGLLGSQLGGIPLQLLGFFLPLGKLLLQGLLCFRPGLSLGELGYGLLKLCFCLAKGFFQKCLGG